MRPISCSAADSCRCLWSFTADLRACGVGDVNVLYVLRSFANAVRAAASPLIYPDSCNAETMFEPASGAVLPRAAFRGRHACCCGQRGGLPYAMTVVRDIREEVVNLIQLSAVYSPELNPIERTVELHCEAITGLSRAATDPTFAQFGKRAIGREVLATSLSTSPWPKT